VIQVQLVHAVLGRQVLQAIQSPRVLSPVRFYLSVLIMR
jgi:hypothetical protein